MLFGTSGIRGKFGEEVSPEMALSVGEALGTYIDKGKVVVGKDPRLTGEILKNSVVSGLLAAGADVVDAGLTSTPAISYITSEEFDAGVMITASHNPPEYNGIKLWQGNGVAFFPLQERKIEELMKNPKLVSWKRIGIYQKEEINEKYNEKIVGSLSVGKKLKVVIDPGNGSGSLHSPIIFKRLGCDVVTINDNPDGRFPNRSPEPSEENLSKLKKAVRCERADFGLAHDGDADRHAVIDEKGKFVPQDKLLALACKHYGGKVVTNVDASMVIEEVAGKKNVIRTRVGDVALVEGILKGGAKFGGETSGCWIHPKIHLGPDGPLSGVLVAKMIAENGPLSRQVSRLPTYPILRKKILLRGREKVMEKIKKSIKYQADYTDGIKVMFEDGWFLLRSSGTEPVIRITAEAKTRRQTKKLMKIAEGLLNVR